MAGSWKSITPPNLSGGDAMSPDTMLLLTDGSVLVHHAYGKQWLRLTPDKKGDYSNPSWSDELDMSFDRQFFATAVLRDGRVCAIGGEYSSDKSITPSGNDAASGEIFDPKTNSWSDMNKPAQFNWIQGDAVACMLPDGRMLLGSLLDSRTATWDPAIDYWDEAGTAFHKQARTKAGNTDEETWTLLQDGSVLTIEITASKLVEKYVPASDTWISEQNTPDQMVLMSVSGTTVNEIGPAMTLPDGRVFAVGGTGANAVYTPPASPTGTGSWSSGPNFPNDSGGNRLTAIDAPAVLLPNGTVLCVAGSTKAETDGGKTTYWSNPTTLFVYDPKAATPLARHPVQPPNGGVDTWMARFLLLPTGQVLMTTQGSTIDIYSPDAAELAFDSSWKPSITSCPSALFPGQTYTLTGTQFNGLSHANSYGDDAQMATNYPIVRLTRADGQTHYLRTHGHSSMGIATGSKPVSTQIDVPFGIEAGLWDLHVIANGIPSDPVAVNLAAYAPTPPAERASLLIPSAVALLAHKRLRDVVEALERKAGGGFYDALSFAGSSEPVVFTATERRVLALAKAARAMFEAGPAVDAAASLPVGQGFGRYAIAGSAAFQLPAYAELWDRNGSWVADTLRRGTPDENMSKVVVGSSQVAVRTGELAVGLVADGAAQARIQSFSMGMLSAVASAVVVDPVLRGLQARRTKLDWNQGLPMIDVATAERRIVQNLLGGSSGGAAWQGWWPKPDDVPDALLDGYLKAIDEAFGVTAAAPPPLTRARLRDGYSLLQLDVSLAAWGAGTWYVALLPMLVVPVVGFALVRALPHGKAFVDPSVHVDERAAWELLTLATGLGALAPAGYSIYLWTQIPENTEAFVEAVVLFGLRAALALGSIGAGDAGAGVRWGLLYAPLALTDVYGLIRGLIEKSRGGPAGFVFLLQTLPVLTGATVLLFALIADALIGAGVDHDVAYFVVLAAMAALLLAGLGIPLAVALSHSGGLRSIIGLDRPQVADALTALTENSGPAALAALFDDSTLWFDPAVNAPTLADLRYPSGRRALLRVWWTGEGDLQINHDDNSVVFKRGDGSTKQVDLPPGKTSAADLAALLVAQMPGVQAEPFAATDPEYDLPWPHTLADPGDTQPTLAAHDLHEHDFAPVGKTRDEGYLLPHTPRVELITTYGATGPSRSQLDAIPLVPAQMLGDLEQSALGTAADLAVLLCMGAAPSLVGSVAAGAGGGAAAEVPGPLTAFTPAGAAPLPGNLGPVFQVFRQWNLDERRVNEWRQLVHGGAVSDQPDPAHADPGMRPDPRVGAYTSPAQSTPPAAPAPAPELVARTLGWVPLWRAWSRIAADVTADASASSPMHYTPTVPLGDGTDFQPTNADLTNGIRFLLDLP